MRVKYLGSPEEQEQTEGLVSGEGAEEEDYDGVEETFVMASPQTSGMKRGATLHDLEYVTPDLKIIPATPPSNISHTPSDPEGNQSETDVIEENKGYKYCSPFNKTITH